MIGTTLHFGTGLSRFGVSSGSLAKFTAIRRVSSRVLCVLPDVRSWSASSVMAALARVVHNRQGAADPEHNRRENNQQGGLHCDIATAALLTYRAARSPWVHLNHVNILSLKEASRQQRTIKNDQVDCCCWLCLSPRNISGSNDTSADSSAGRHDHAGGLRLRPG